jgi:cytochrome c5
VSKHDTHFFNTFSMVIGLLIVIALVLMALARSVAARTEVAEVYSDARYVAAVNARTAPFLREAVAGKDNSAMKIEAPATATTVAMAIPKDGASLFQSTCSACHGAGIAGAPKAGDKAAWAPRLAEGMPMLYQHALQGFTGKTGTMPPKGGRADLNDALIKQGVDYMAQMAK